MTRKLSLPLLHLSRSAVLSAPTPGALHKPTVDEMRKRLGGRASTEADAGDIVELITPGGQTLRGVVLFARGEDVDVWVEQPEAPAESAAPAASSKAAAPGPSGAPAASARPATGVAVVRRARRADVRPLGPPISKALHAVSCDARVFASLAEGQRIRFQNDRSLEEATLLEKCRFGALIQRADGSLLGVGFRRIWPVQPSDAERN